MVRPDGMVALALCGSIAWGHGCTTSVRRSTTAPTTRSRESTPLAVPPDAVRSAVPVSRTWPRWEPSAASQAALLCRATPSEPAHAPERRHVEGGGVVDFAGLGPVGIGRGARVESESWRMWDGWSYRCFIRDFSVLVHDEDLDCATRRLVTTAVATRVAALRRCADNARRVTVLLDLVLAPDGRVYPVEASVDRASMEVAECLARHVAGSRGPSHEGPEWAQIALAFVWPGPFCRVPATPRGGT